MWTMPRLARSDESLFLEILDALRFLLRGCLRAADTLYIVRPALGRPAGWRVDHGHALGLSATGEQDGETENQRLHITPEFVWA